MLSPLGDRQMSRTLTKILIVNTAIALMPPLMLVVLSIDNVSFHRLLLTFLYSWIYANCIGGLNFATIPFVGRPVGGFPPGRRGRGEFWRCFLNRLPAERFRGRFWLAAGFN